MIRLNDIVVKFGDFTALHGINVHVKEGEFFTFLGPSGCGKTTTLRTITGFIEPVEGAVVVKDRDITHVPIEDRNIGIVFQSYALFPTMTVYDNIAFGLKVKKVKRAEIDQRVRDIARKVDLSDEQLQKAVSQLSGGQQQRVAIARALVTNPAIICMDEPLSNLDAKLRVQLRNELKKMQKDFGITTIYVTHDQEEALAVSDRIAVMNMGVVEQVGMPYDIYAHPVNAFVANFIGTSNFLEAEATSEGVRVMGAAPIPAKLKDGRTGKVQVAVRPEHITLNAPQPGKLEGEIKIFTFLGDYINYEVQLANGQVIQANQYLNQKTGFHQKGEKVSIEFSTINVFDAEGKEALL